MGSPALEARPFPAVLILRLNFRDYAGFLASITANAHSVREVPPPTSLPQHCSSLGLDRQGLLRKGPPADEWARFRDPLDGAAVTGLPQPQAGGVGQRLERAEAIVGELPGGS